MNTAGSDGFGQTVVRIVLVFWEYLFPLFDETSRNRLGTDVHEPPLVQLIIGKVHLATLYRLKNILGPRNEQPDYRTLFF